MTPITDKQHYLKVIHIINKLNDKIFNNKEKSVFGFAVMYAIDNYTCPADVFSFIRESAEDNYKLVADVIGIELLEEILNLKN